MDVAHRQEVRSRVGDLCEYCRLPQSALYLCFHIEHVIARQHDGGDDLDNLAPACDRCNLYKGPNLSAIDPQSGALVRLFNPRMDEWQRHFRLHDAVIEGFTEIGRATAHLLQMNAEHRVQLRRYLTPEQPS